MAVMLLLVGALLFGVWEYLLSADRLTESLTDSSSPITVGGYAGSIGAFFVIWFAGSLFRAMRPLEPFPGWLSALAFGGSIAAGVACWSGRETPRVTASPGVATAS